MQAWCSALNSRIACHRHVGADCLGDLGDASAKSAYGRAAIRSKIWYFCTREGAGWTREGAGWVPNSEDYAAKSSIRISFLQDLRAAAAYFRSTAHHG
jgi:hypothetical protein